MKRSQNRSYRWRRHCRGQAATESVMAILLLSLIFFGLMQVAYVYAAQLIAHHANFVTARSHAVGFEPAIVMRAKEVGSIGLAGPIYGPESAVGLTPAQLAAIEPMLIEDHIQNIDGGSLDYELWPNVYARLPSIEVDGMANGGIDVWWFPLEMPMRAAYTSREWVHLHSRLRFVNHATFYLE